MIFLEVLALDQKLPGACRRKGPIVMSSWCLFFLLWSWAHCHRAPDEYGETTSLILRGRAVLRYICVLTLSSHRPWFKTLLILLKQWNNSFFPWLWFTWGRDSTLGSTLEAGSVNLGREICALWLRIQIYLSFIITRGQKLILGAKSPFINNFIKSAFIIK